jgi:hypothetical protein
MSNRTLEELAEIFRAKYPVKTPFSKSKIVISGDEILIHEVDKVAQDWSPSTSWTQKKGGFGSRMTTSGRFIKALNEGLYKSWGNIDEPVYIFNSVWNSGKGLDQDEEFVTVTGQKTGSLSIGGVKKHIDFRNKNESWHPDWSAGHIGRSTS